MNFKVWRTSIGSPAGRPCDDAREYQSREVRRWISLKEVERYRNHYDQPHPMEAEGEWINGGKHLAVFEDRTRFSIELTTLDDLLDFIRRNGNARGGRAVVTVMDTGELGLEIYDTFRERAAA